MSKFIVSKEQWAEDSGIWVVNILRATNDAGNVRNQTYDIMDTIPLVVEYFPPQTNSAGKTIWQLPEDNTMPKLNAGAKDQAIKAFRKRRKDKKKRKSSSNSNKPLFAQPKPQLEGDLPVHSPVGFDMKASSISKDATILPPPGFESMNPSNNNKEPSEINSQEVASVYSSTLMKARLDLTSKLKAVLDETSLDGADRNFVLGKFFVEMDSVLCPLLASLKQANVNLENELLGVPPGFEQQYSNAHLGQHHIDR